MPFKQTLKYAAIRAGLETVALTRAGALWPAAGGRGLIFTLHHVRPAGPEPFAPNALLSVTPQFLDRAIEACAESGLTPVTLEDLPARLSDPADTRRFVSFTLDDGYRNNAEHAAPVFRRHGVPFTIFVTGGFVERTRSAWWETAEALIRGTNEAEFDFGDGPEKVAMRTVAEKDAAFHRFSRFVQTEDEDEAVAIEQGKPHAGAIAFRGGVGHRKGPAERDPVVFGSRKPRAALSGTRAIFLASSD